MDTKFESLIKIPLFSSLTENELEIFSSTLKKYDRENDITIFNEGDSGEEMFILLEGRVGIFVKTQDENEIEIDEITTGNFFGEMSIFDNIPRSATCKTKDKSVLLGLSAKSFFESIDKYPEIAIKIIYKMVNIIAGRLERTGAFLSDIVLWGEKARKRAITDEFTGLYNRRFYDDIINEQFKKTKEINSFLSLIMLDLDHFGTLNKEYGQKTGDEIILSASNIFKQHFRKDDILVRYGGDEFVFIMKDTESEKALEICNNVIEKLRSINLENTEGKKIKEITGSIGIASFPTHAKDLETLKSTADKAVYQAKDGGRNKAVIYKN